MEHFNFFHQSQLSDYLTHRKGETKLGEKLVTLRKGHGFPDLPKYKERGVRFVVLGIPESVGVQGNYGRPGTERAWEAFLNGFLNVQSNRFLDGAEVLLLGHVVADDLQERSEALDRNSNYYMTRLHMLCAELDEIVQPIIASIVTAGMIPIVIGGGHNNTFPIIGGTAEVQQGKKVVHAINLDAHADFRVLEGRHSGNGFSYAKDAGTLDKYYVVGLHESYNNENMLRTMDGTRNVRYCMLEEITYLDKALLKAIEFVKDENVSCGIELDLDAIRMMPSSAMGPSGFSLEQARHFVRTCAKSLRSAYLHLPEAAPNDEKEARVVGKALTYLVTDFVKNCIAPQ